MKEKSYLIVKRIIDIVASLLAVILFLPIYLIIAFLIKITSKGPVIFVQKRVGLNGNIFRMYKFRTMVVNAEELKKNLLRQNKMSGPMFKLEDDPRITKLGKFMRKTSIDELPQLINVLKGEMSLVGPRPSLPEEVKMFKPWMLKRLEVKPGLTCTWQVGGRNSIDYENWMEMDIEYIQVRNTMLDLKLIFKTLKVFFGDENAK